MVRCVITSLLLYFLSCSRCAAHYDNCTNGITEYIGDGDCDWKNNNELCDYDGGDCCACSCVDGNTYECGVSGYNCIDPACLDSAYASDSAYCTGNPNYINDGYCDSQNNNPSCEYDGGDCCECTCIDGDLYACGSYGYNCTDPACADPDIVAKFPNCTGNLVLIGDGLCTAQNNNPLCGYDDGDCCMCTCINSNGIACAFGDFKCLDPEAGNEIYDCKTPPPDALPCSGDAQRTWVVENLAQARELATAINCFGGAFEVEWKANIVVDSTIYVVDGTVLNVTGVGSNAGMDGNSDSRLFVVVNASLHIRGITISYGAGFAGGAIVASRSTLTFDRTTFLGNNAQGNGGALYVSDGSSVFFSRETYFSSNNAQGNGGALYVSDGSIVSWSGTPSFTGNSALNGGALYVNLNSSVSLDGRTSFNGNTAVYVNDEAVNNVGSGGSLCADLTTLSWSGQETLANNAAHNGGAIFARETTVSMGGTTSFAGNNASFFGGALYLENVNVSWNGEAEFVDNWANCSGGALLISRGSSVIWSGKATFTKNSAAYRGGALSVYGSNISWSEDATLLNGNMTFFNNSADFGGDLYVDSANMFWDGQVELVDNWAVYGGALDVQYSSVVWSGEASFITNSAAVHGGALYVQYSNVYWGEDVTFFGNDADGGGAIYIADGSIVDWRGNTEFTSNKANSDGGAVQYFSSDSVLAMGGTTSFVNNTCGANGGALALLGGSSVSFETTRGKFVGNSADVAGGAIFVADANVGLVFFNTTFMYNSAQVGGGVYASASGNTKSSSYGTLTENPTTFNGCRFIGNRAKATGGAIESAAGEDVIINTSFVGNTAGVGGALRLAGTAELDNCSFVENISDADEGAAVSNIGYISSMAQLSFTGNVFRCTPTLFLDYAAGDALAAVCHGCDEPCQNCSFDPVAIAPTCTGVMEHSSSPGGSTTLEMVSIDRGYWRANASSRNVLACYNTNACLGGETENSGYCLEGYEGPYCSVCSRGYAATLGLACRKCSNNTGSIVVAVVLLVAALIAAGVMALYLVSEELEGTGGGAVGCLKRYIPLQSLKIQIVVWQILTQFTAVANVTYPDVYQRFLDGVDVLNFHVGWVLSAGCIADVDFHDNLLIATTGPIVGIAFLGATYAVALHKNRGNNEALQNVLRKHVSMVLLLTFLVYSSVSSILFRMFACELLDDGRNYLRADYRIECDSSKHRRLQIHAGVMICLYTVGIPALYAGLLFRDRKVLKTEDVAGRPEGLRIRLISSLWKPYRPSAFYYEVIECGRRIILAGAVVFIYPNTAAQIAVSLIAAFAFAIMSEGIAPYAFQWDTWINRMGQVVVFVSLYVALLLKVDVSDERGSSQHVFEVVLVAAHVCMMLSIVAETVVMAWSLKKPVQEDSYPQTSTTGSSRNTMFRIGSLPSATEDFPFPDGILEAQITAIPAEHQPA